MPLYTHYVAPDTLSPYPRDAWSYGTIWLDQDELLSYFLCTSKNNANTGQRFMSVVDGPCVFIISPSLC